MQFTDYNAEAIAAKLKQVEDFEAKYGENDMSKAWRKWCNDHQYRRREWPVSYTHLTLPTKA